MKKPPKGWIKHIIVVILQFILNPRLLLCFGIGWMITNGWAYVFLGVGLRFDIGWMMAVGAGYLAFLWLPVSAEKIVTVAIAMLLLRWLFPKDEKTLGMLRKLSEKLKIKGKEQKERRKRKKLQKQQEIEEPKDTDSENRA